MIAFRNYVNGTKVADWQDDGGDNIAFSRDEPSGFIAINNGKKDKDASYTTSLADGEYCNVYATMDCSKTVTVKGGKVETTVPAHSAIALYAGATKASHPAASAATDPSDPDVSQIDDEDDALPDDRSVTIYYKPANSDVEDPEGPLRPRQRLGAAGSRHDPRRAGLLHAPPSTPRARRSTSCSTTRTPMVGRTRRAAATTMPTSASPTLA